MLLMLLSFLVFQCQALCRGLHILWIFNHRYGQSESHFECLMHLMDHVAGGNITVNKMN